MKSIFTLENKWISFFSYAGICLATVYLLLYIAPINTNDDVYIYFNFAKNFAQGNFFSMDSRGLPVDACTGILYLILLVPFELLQVNPMFWGFMLNVLAFLGSSFIFSRILFFFFSDKLVSLFGFLSFVLLNVLQDRLIGIIGWSFETWFSPFFLFLLSYFTLFYDHKKLTFPIGFSLIYISGVLVRPENILLYSPVFLLLFLKQKNPSLLIIKTVISLSVLLILLFSIKYLIFNDFFPTGYYRKFSSNIKSSESSTNYILDWSLLFLQLAKYAFLLLLALIFIYYKKIEIKYLLPFGVLFLVLALNIIFVYKTIPLVGYFFRYLILASQVFLAGLVALLILFFKFFTENKVLFRTTTVFMFFFLVNTIFAYTKIHNRKQILEHLNVYARCEFQMKTHPYIRFGNYLKKNVSKVPNLVICMGDGGAVPYAAECINIDPAGLTESYIAKLAIQPKEGRAKKFSDYILSNNPDIIFITSGKVSDSTELSENLDITNHLPISFNEFILFLKDASKNDYAYLSSWRADNSGFGMPYDWHFIVNRKSKHFQALRKSLLAFSSDFGYRKVGDFKYSFENDTVTLKRCN